MRAEVQNGSITALLFKVFTETELRELGLEDLAIKPRNMSGHFTPTVRPSRLRR